MSRCPLRGPAAGCLATVLAALLLASCGPKSATKPDPFFQKWRDLAKTATGYSPPQVKHTPDVTLIREVAIEDEGEPTAQPARPLPDQPVTLSLSNVDAGVLLRSLAKAADISVVLSSSVTGELSLDVKNLPWSQVFLEVLRNQGLTYDWDGDLLRVTSVDDLKREVAIEEETNKRLAKRRESRELVPLTTSVIGIRYADAEALREELSSVLTKNDKGEARGSIIVNEHNNTLIVQAIRDDLERITKLIDSLDKPRAQVQLKAHIVEATKETARDLGIQWGGFYQDGNLMLTPGLVGNTDNTLSPMFPGQKQGLPGLGANFPADVINSGRGAQMGLAYGDLMGNFLEFQLSALQSDGKLNIMSSPSITTLDNQPAFTENGQSVPVVAQDGDDLNVRYEDAVLRLEITPHVIDKTTLRLKVLVKKDEVDDTRPTDALGNPRIVKNQTETNLIVFNGETIVISGLTRRREYANNEGVPFLDQLPGLGRLFRRDSNGHGLDEILIFITPTILPFRQVQANVTPTPAATPGGPAS